MKKNFFKINIFLLLALSFCIFGCAVMESAGRFLDGSIFEEKRKALYKSLEKDGSVADMELSITENKNNETYFTISISKYPMFKLRALKSSEEGAFNFTSLEYLAGSTHGWNEFSLELIGEGNFDSENGVLQILEIELVQITKGRIQRYDTRLTSANALTALRNRRERINAITSWMTSREAPSLNTAKEFTNYWEPLFFPEIVPKKKRPQNWLEQDDIRQKEDDINWNLSYTERVFSEELWTVRNTGTLLRDWEEAFSWIYMEYNWEYIVELLINEIKFNKIK